MKSITFDKLKEKIKKSVRYELMKHPEILLTANVGFIKCGIKPIDANLYYSETSIELINKITAIIDQWDIRQYKSLIEIFPSNVPNWVNNAQIGYDDNGQWILFTN